MCNQRRNQLGVTLQVAVGGSDREPLPLEPQNGSRQLRPIIAVKPQFRPIRPDTLREK